MPSSTASMTSPQANGKCPLSRHEVGAQRCMLAAGRRCCAIAKHACTHMLMRAIVFLCVTPYEGHRLDGVLSNCMRTACADETPILKWLVLDGPVDTLWIE